MKRIGRKIKLKDMIEKNGMRGGKQTSYMPGFESSLI